VAAQSFRKTLPWEETLRDVGYDQASPASRPTRPGVGQWRAAARMATARKFHTSTLLFDGSVLVVGGSDGAGELQSVERYEPGTDLWHSAAAPSVTRCHHHATRLLNGSVLVTGGFSGVALCSAELFNPTENQWRPAAAIHHGHGHGLHSATLLQDGQVLVASSSGAEVFDPERNAWTPVAYFGRDYQTATLMLDGQVLLVGGAGPWDDPSTAATVTRFNPATGRCQAMARLPQPRVRHTNTLLANGHLLVAAGDDGGTQYASHALCFEPTSNRWSRAGTLVAAREYCTATRLMDDSVLLAGGDGAAGILASAERFDSSSNRWLPVAPLLEARYLHSATLLADGRLLVVGGVGQSAALASAEIFYIDG
jgi:hypothetical protein